jgi:hypothetical protein
MKKIEKIVFILFKRDWLDKHPLRSSKSNRCNSAYLFLQSEIAVTNFAYALVFGPGGHE